ncbi:MAG: DUF4097 family beta strand repeat protein [Pyrinomonadaceae bacterium]|nr:DUF4097 family beta strand repeat protein [Pyrinomonadaceae bacterium]
MNKKNVVKFVVLSLFLAIFSLNLFAQKQSKTAKLIKRTKHVTESVEFGSGGTISITGAPLGSVQVEGWNKSEVEITAEIIVQAANEADLEKLAAVCGFSVDDSGMTHLRITSVGTHDKKYLKRVAKKFPKRLRGAPFTVNYKIKTPVFSDLVIDGGHGDLNISSVEGTMRISYVKSNAKLNLRGGTVQATIGSGDVDVTVATRSWRGRFAEIKVLQGSLNVWLPQNLHANLTASVLRNGKIDNSYKLLKPMRKTKFTEKDMRAKAGNGGAQLSFTIGDGILKIADFEKPAE